MKYIEAIIIGGGQAGLAMSYCLKELGVGHLILERGRLGERWRSERWDSLRLLTPRWQSRLPGWQYGGDRPHGFMTKDEVVDYLANYARSFAAPLREGVTVQQVSRCGGHFRVDTDAGAWLASSVIVATGHCDRPAIPACAGQLPAGIAQVVPQRYRNPSTLPQGGVLVVGASATGAQLALEIAVSGRPVTLAVGGHIRLPRRYRGRDIMEWLDAVGALSQSIHEVPDLTASRAQPSLQLVGSDEGRSLDLNALQEAGVRLVGRVRGFSGNMAHFADDLGESVGRAEAKMARQLDRIDRFIASHGLEGACPREPRPDRISVPRARTQVDLKAEGLKSVLWATGYQRRYPWLRLPVLDGRGEILQREGITPEPGLYVLGLNFMRRRNSSFLDGVGADAAFLAERVFEQIRRGKRTALGPEALAVAGA